MKSTRNAKATSISIFILPYLISAISISFAQTTGSPLIVSITSPVTISVTQGSEKVLAHSVVLRNEGTAPLGWIASANQAWLRFEPTSGLILPKATVFIDVIADPAGFAPGIYVASGALTSPNMPRATFEVTMTEQSAFTAVATLNAERTFPVDSGMVNVKTTYGAKGDGISDDTVAIQTAISSVVHHPQTGPRIIFLPAGTYLVSRPLLEKDRTGHWNSLLTLQGENRATTVIKLKDNDPLYQSTVTPADVLEFGSQNGTSAGGGNSAFDNNIFDITIDIGRGNPGAVALDFLGNNYCALRNVTLQSSDHSRSGAIGLALLRYATGPCLLKNVVINGFDYGIKIANTEYSLTLEDISLLNQKFSGIYNAGNVLSIRHLFSTNSVPALSNVNAAGLVTLVDAILQGGSSKVAAIQNQGTLYARGVTSSGYASALPGQGSAITEFASGPVVSLFGGNTSLNLPVEKTPVFEETNLKNWVSVTAYGADPTGVAESSGAIQAAMNSGATTVYFPTGVYLVTRTLHVGGKLRMIEGFDSSLNPGGEAFNRADRPTALFKIEGGAADVTLHHFRLGAYYPYPAPGVVFVQQDSDRPLVLSDSLIGGQPTTIGYQNTSRGTGTLFVENVAAHPWQILYPQNVFARQINPEGNTTKITNWGGKLWILGLKTEGIGTNIETEQGGSTEVLGGLIYPVWKTAPDSASFVVSDSRASFIYALSSYKPAGATNFPVQIRETQHGETKSLFSTSLPRRGFGTIVPLYSSGYSSPISSQALPDHTNHH